MEKVSTFNAVDFIKLPGLDGVALANVVTNTQTIGTGVDKTIASLISFDDGSTWSSLKAPEIDSQGVAINCLASSVFFSH